MELKQLLLKNYGKFTNVSVNFDSGLNVIYGANEYGKTTIYSFIREMIFGMERGKGRGARKDPFRIYEPWENAGYYAGEVTFLSDDKTFILNRNFDKYNKSVSLICQEDLEILSVEDGDLNILLGNISRLSYENTVAIPQCRVETTEDLAVELNNFAANIYSAEDDEIRVEEALKYLKDKKKKLETQERMRQEQQNVLVSQLYGEQAYISKDIGRLTSALEETEHQILKQKQVKVSQEADEQSNLFTQLAIKPMWYLLLGIAMVLVILLIKKPVNMIIAAGLALGGGMVIWNRFKYRYANLEPQQPIERADLLEKLQWEKNRITSEIKEKQIAFDNLQEQIIELREGHATISSHQKQIQAIEMAMLKIQQVSQEIQLKFAKMLNKEISTIFCGITNEEYDGLIVNDKLEVTLYKQNKPLMIEQVSRGTVEQVYFALRMAITDIIHQETLPIILDDTFVYYDDVRLEYVLNWLATCNRQVILLTCQKREREILERNKVQFQNVRIQKPRQ